MTSTDPIADMITRIRNSSAVNKPKVSMPHSKVKEAVASLLAQRGFIDTVSTEPSASGVGSILTLTLFGPQSNPRITQIDRLSRPGRRNYVGAKAIPVIKRGRGMVIVSTSKGILTGDQARKEGVGGELICRVY